MPSTPIGGMYYIKTALDTNSAISTSMNDNNIISALSLTSPLTAMKTDLKTDDGIASTGDMRSASMNWNTGCGDSTNGANRYKPNIGGKACDIGFLLGN